MTTAAVVRKRTPLPAAERDAVLALVGAAADADGTVPLSEQALLLLRTGTVIAPVHLLLLAPDGQLAGYAQVDPRDPVTGPAAELLVHPRYRRRGLGRSLLAAALDAAGAGTPPGDRVRLRVWAHGDHPAAGVLAREFAFTRDRVLWRMRRPLAEAPPAHPLPAGITLRAFRPGVDEDEWVAVNARAFADHPEQGRWTAADLRLRMAEPWFDPAGFLLAVDAADRLVGYHWTKVHAGDQRQAPIGEVYVLGVDPSVHGRGLGVALTVAGLRHLHGQGLTRAMLYVDEANRAAVALYGKLGFTRWSTDVNYRR